MNALELLKHDHDRMKKMMNDLEHTSDGARKRRMDLFDRARKELAIHEQIEEEILYPTFKAQAKLKEIVLEGYEEHHVADLVVGELVEIDVNNEKWAAKIKVLKENLEHHIEEEETEMFPRARKVFSSEELEELGRRLQTRKRELTKEDVEEIRHAA
jgi:hemerythrin-like domain-containing protein